MQKNIELTLPLNKIEVINAIEKKEPSRIPLVNAKWWGEGFVEKHGEELKKFDSYPEDVYWLMTKNPVDTNKMNLSWNWKKSSALDSNCVIDNWDKLDEFIEKLPRPETDTEFIKEMEIKGRAAKKDGRYILFGWWYFFFEKSWLLLGMEKLLCDFIENKDSLHKIFSGICKTYNSYIEAANQMCNPDGFWVSDDLGHQKGPIVSPRIFHEMLLPYYTVIGNTLKKKKIHF